MKRLLKSDNAVFGRWLLEGRLGLGVSLVILILIFLNDKFLWVSSGVGLFILVALIYGVFLLTLTFCLYSKHLVERQVKASLWTFHGVCAFAYISPFFLMLAETLQTYGFLYVVKSVYFGQH